MTLRASDSNLRRATAYTLMTDRSLPFLPPRGILPPISSCRLSNQHFFTAALRLSVHLFYHFHGTHNILSNDWRSEGGPTSDSPPPERIHPSASTQHHSDGEIIPTTIVIKNIPFNIKRETLLNTIVGLIILLNLCIHLILL